MIGSVGGVGTTIPYLRLFFNFFVRDALVLSACSITTASALRYGLNFRTPHPMKLDLEKKKSGLVIDYSLMLITIPPMLIGVVGGIYLSWYLPEPCLTAGLLCSHMFLAYKMGGRAIAAETLTN
jgi:uncharacterized membrane protein YfcA